MQSVLRSVLRSAWLLVLLLCATASAAALPSPQAGKLTVYFLDVGQGDAALVVTPTGKSILVDGGPPESARATADKVASIVRGPLDLVVLSHPHLDHVGGLLNVLSRVGARNYLESGFDHPTRSYERVLSWLADHEVAYVEAAQAANGKPFSLDVGGGAALAVYWPRRPVDPFLLGTRSDANANSVVMRLTYGRTSFLFAGDAEAETETQLVRSGFPLQSTVLKVPHHGSRFSNQARFVSRVAPSVAVVSCGVGNEYGHPHLEALRRYQDAGARVLRTDLDGDVVAVSDGTHVDVRASGKQRAPPGLVRTPGPDRKVVPASAEVAYLASRNSDVFHLPTCRNALRIQEKNLIVFRTRAEAAHGRRPAGDCNP